MKRAVPDDWPDDEERPFDLASVLVGLDANALDPNRKRDDEIDRFMRLVRAGRVKCWIGPGVRAEIATSSSPLHGVEAAEGSASSAVRALNQAHDCGSDRKPVAAFRRHALTAAQHIARIRVRSILGGNAKAGKHAADAVHVSEAAEAGCSHFISYDSRILRKRHDLEALAVPTMRIVTLEEFLAIASEARPGEA